MFPCGPKVRISAPTPNQSNQQRSGDERNEDRIGNARSTDELVHRHVVYRSHAGGMPAKTYEAGINQRVVVIEFDSVAQATAAHDSAEYQAALKALGDGADRDIRIVEGVS